MDPVIIAFIGLLLMLLVGAALLYPAAKNRRSILEPGKAGETLPKSRRDKAANKTGPSRPGPRKGEIPSTQETLDHAERVPDSLATDQLVGAKPRFRDRLDKTRGLFGGYLNAITGRGSIDQESWDDLEEALIRADVGVSTTTNILDELRTRVKSEGIKTPQDLIEALKTDLKKTLSSANRDLNDERCNDVERNGANVWLFVGVNGVGKTTSIGKVGLRYAQRGRSVLMAAGDTFRAAAAEQLTVWAQRANADIVRGQEGGDPGAVIFDAIEKANAHNVDMVLADTAGRLHTKFNLMEELKKVKRISERPPANLTEILLVIDATTGQNGLVQAKQFSEAVDCTGVVLTKLDGTAKGGIAIAIQTELGLPIKLVGLGETAEDLVDFDPDEFVDALFE